MAALHIGSNETTFYGRLQKNVLTNMQLGHQGLDDLLATMTLMLDGDGSSDAHYTYMQTHFGYLDNATAHAAYNELLSLQAKFNTDGSVSNVKSALAQAFAKFR